MDFLQYLCCASKPTAYVARNSTTHFSSNRRSFFRESSVFLCVFRFCSDVMMHRILLSVSKKTGSPTIPLTAMQQVFSIFQADAKPERRQRRRQTVAWNKLKWLKSASKIYRRHMMMQLLRNRNRLECRQHSKRKRSDEI